MSRLIFANAPGFEEAYAALLADRSEAVDAVDGAVKSIVADVRTRGFEAVAELTSHHDRVALTPESFAVSPERIKAAVAACPADVLRALKLAAARILDFHVRAIPTDARWTDAVGVELGWRWTPVDAAGLYAPGGLAAYPSSVLMNALPAKAAGVKRIVMVTPPARIDENPAILAAAHIAGVDEVYAVGGAQAIAALAYGAGPLSPVNVIAGPGNSWVATAKKQVFGDVGIDSIAGPSEVFIIADSANDPEIIAADLLAQAEHDAVAQSLLFTDDAAFGQAVIAAVAGQLARGEAAASAAASWENHGAVVVVANLEDACALCDQGAPEHLQIATDNPDALGDQIRHAGAIFLGRWTPEAVGDYLAGPNHVLPTGGRAKWASGLTTHHFMKRTTLIGTSRQALAAIGGAGAVLARSEGLTAHAASLTRRLDRLP
jgi:histidinol dehydrogenase